MDDPNQSANTMNRDYMESMGVIVDRLEAEKDSIKGVIIQSAKKTFFAGGDLNDLITVTKKNAAEFSGFVEVAILDLIRPHAGEGGGYLG